MKENKTEFSGVKVEQSTLPSGVGGADVGTTIDQSQLIRGIQPDYFHLPGGAFVSCSAKKWPLEITYVVAHNEIVIVIGVITLLR